VHVYARKMVTRYHYNTILTCKMINFLMLFVGDLFELIGGLKKLECTVNFFFLVLGNTSMLAIGPGKYRNDEVVISSIHLIYFYRY
jgi:hypothetical protein